MKRLLDERVRAALRRVWPDAATLDSVEIRALGGGVVPRTFLGVAGAQRYVLRMSTTRPVALLDLATEALAMRAAAAADLAPAVVAVDLAAGLLLTEYRMTPYRAEEVSHPIAIRTIVRSLRALHALRVDVPVYAVESIAARYLAALRADTTRQFTQAESAWADELLQRARHFEAAHAPTAFCHTDLVASNILTDGASARLIDFEYAGRAAPLLDLASFAGLNGFTEEQRRLLLDEYYGKSQGASFARELDDTIRMVRLLGYFWARLAAQRIVETDAYAGLAAQLGTTLK